MISLNGEVYQLPYLFEAEYQDGTIYKQTPEDISTQRNDKNSFFDIYYEPIKPLSELVRFTIIGKGHTYSVFLTDGHFEVDGIPFKLHEGIATPQLVFYKTHYSHINYLTGQSVGHDMEFVIGWKHSDSEQYKLIID